LSNTIFVNPLLL